MWIDRPDEMTFLEVALVTKREPVVAITGPRGSGKTALSMMFIEKHAGAFTSVHRLDATVGMVREPSALREMTDNIPAGSLIVVDDADLTNEVAAFTRRLIAAPNGRQMLILSESRLQGTDGSLRQLELPRADVLDLVYRVEPYVIGGLRREPTPVEAAILGASRDLGLSRADVERALAPFFAHAILDPNGRPIVSGSREQNAIILVSDAVNDEFLRGIDENPARLYELPPREFEEVVCELLRRQGYETELTPISRDGGKDIYAARKTDIGSFLFLVECKRYAPDNPVGVHIIRELYGTVQAEHATAGVVATTSRFTKDAVEFQSSVKHQMSLQDYLGVRRWVQKSLQMD